VTEAPGNEHDLPALQRRLEAFAAARDWQPYHTPKNLAAALSVEASELLEIFQWLTPEQSARVMEEPDGAHRVADEVADVLAYLLQFCEVLGIDAGAALAAKIDRNERRFPLPGASGGPGAAAGDSAGGAGGGARSESPDAPRSGGSPGCSPEESKG